MQMETQGVTYSFPVLVPAPGENSGKFGSGVVFLGGGRWLVEDWEGTKTAEEYWIITCYSKYKD